MKVSIELSPEYSEPYAIIYADKITDNIQHTLDIFGSNESPITALQNENDIVSDFICIYDGIWFAIFRGKFNTYFHVKSSFLFGELIIQYFIYNVSHLDVSGEKTCVRCVKGG
jgi:hypothetical protein